MVRQSPNIAGQGPLDFHGQQYIIECLRKADKEVGIHSPHPNVEHMTVVEVRKFIQAVHRIQRDHMRNGVWPVEPEIVDDAAPEPVVLNQLGTEDCPLTQSRPKQQLSSKSKHGHAACLRKQLTRGEHLLPRGVGDGAVQVYSG